MLPHHLLWRFTAAVILPASTLAASRSAITSRFWDCCKPSCSWPEKAGVNQPVRACDKFNTVISDETIENGCDTRSPDAAFTCTDNAPWNVNRDLSFGFASTTIAGGKESDWCCACYKLVFTSGAAVGKTMIIQSTSTGVDSGTTQFDLLIPGGGIGEFQNGCLRQFGQVFPGKPQGGLDGRPECGELPTQRLRDGCYWRFDWFGGANNPAANFTQVRCPDELTSRSGCKRTDDSEYPAYTLTRRPMASGATRATGNPKTSPRTTKTSKAASIRTTATKATTKATTKLTNKPSAAVSTVSAHVGGDGVVPLWGHCGGKYWEGPTVCVKGTTCQEQSPYYSQCRPPGDPGPLEVSTTASHSSVVPSLVAHMYDRCGGLGWTGPKMCAPGSTCQVQDKNYSLCLPPDDDKEDSMIGLSE